MHMGNLAKIKDWVWQSDNRACFIERERALMRLRREMADDKEPNRYARAFSTVLHELSTPVLECDYFAGRMVEALPEEEMEPLPYSPGHVSPDYGNLLRVGFRGILQEIRKNAERKGDADSLSFARDAEIMVEAIREYSLRYAAEAERMGKMRMAEALRRVPIEPAYDFYSALQAVWLVHMIASCCVGARDYAFGRFDQYMFPFYEQALQNGETEEELTELLAGFLVKCNEICGRTTHNHKIKPIPCNASKQYINIGGENPNRFSHLVLEAAVRVNMAQPQIVVLLKPEADAEFTEHVFQALEILTDKMNLYHYEPIRKELIRKGIPAEIAKDFTYSACCTFELNYHTNRAEYYIPSVQLFLKTLHCGEYRSVEEILEAYTEALRVDEQAYVERIQNRVIDEAVKRDFLFLGLVMTDAAKECRYPCERSVPYHIMNLFFSGIATIGDSLMVLDRLVYKEKRYSYRAFLEILKNNYEENEPLRQEIRNMTRFGNDTDADRYAVMVGNAFLKATDSLQLQEHFYTAPGFYSLERDNTWCWYDEIGATPDGRKAREPFSENQSPTYGADQNGITALLNSIAKLPLDRTVTGGLNLTFSRSVSAEILQALVVSFFQKGGFHVGISVIDRETLQDAMVNPEKYKSLTVRLYGFSEYFISLPKWQQLAVLNRTEYSL